MSGRALGTDVDDKSAKQQTCARGVGFMHSDCGRARRNIPSYPQVIRDLGTELSDIMDTKGTSYPHYGDTIGMDVAGGSDGAGLRLDSAGQVCDLIEQTTPFGHELADLAICVHHRGVITATERLSDLGQGQVGELTAQVHGDLSSRHEHTGAA